MSRGHLVKAYIYDEDHHKPVLHCLFNPQSYSFSKTNSWQVNLLPGQNVAKASFQGGQAMTMSFQLFFDTSLDSGGEAIEMQILEMDVRGYTNKLLELMKIDPQIKDQDTKSQKGRPPIVSFHWGNYWSFKGVINSVNLQFTMFDSTGTPLRATADVQLQQVEEDGQYPRQNPTSGGEGVRASRIVQPGDTIDGIAYEEYGDPTVWRRLADVNGLDNPRDLRPGQRLVVPSLL